MKERAERLGRTIALALLIAGGVGWTEPLRVLGQTTPAPAVTPSVAPSPLAADPCGGETRLLATLNRPTVGYSACAVAPGTVVIEEGYQNQQGSSSNPSTLIQYPQSFTRIGVKERFEVDVIGPYFNRLAVPDGTGGLTRTSGYQDGGLGFKYEFVPTGRFVVGVDGLYTAPSGSRGFTSGGPSETANLDVAYAVTPTFGIGTTLAFSSTSGFTAVGKQSGYNAFLPSGVLTAQLRDNYQLYAEYVYLSKLAPDQGGRAFVDYGVQHLLGKRFEIDLEQGLSITPDSNLKFSYIGFGFGVQFK